MMGTYNDTNGNKKGEAKSKTISSIKNTNLLSLAMIIISLLVLIFFFILGSGHAYAQDATSLHSGDGSQGYGEGGLEYIFLALGIDALHTGDYEQALSDFNTSLAENEEFVPTYAAMALVYLAMDDSDTALEYALAGQAIDDEAAEIAYVLGTIYYEMGDFAEAIIQYHDYLEQAHVSEPAMMQRMFKDDETMTSLIVAENQMNMASERLTAIGG